MSHYTLTLDSFKFISWQSLTTMADWYLCALRNDHKNLETERIAAIQRLSHRFIYLGIAESSNEYDVLKVVFYETLDLLNHYPLAGTFLRYELFPELTNAIKCNLENCVEKFKNHDSDNSLTSNSKAALNAVNELEKFKEWEKSKANRLSTATRESFRRDWDIGIEEYKLSDLLCNLFSIGFEYKIYLCAVGSSQRDFGSKKGAAIGMLSDDCVYLGNSNYDQVESLIGVIFYQILDIFNISTDAASLLKLNYLPQAISIIEADLRDVDSRRLHPGLEKMELKKFERWIALKSERKSKVELENNKWKQGLDSDLKSRKIRQIF